MARLNAAIIGSGNIGTDLLHKLLRSDVVAPTWMVGIDPASDGLARARSLGVETTYDGIDGLLPALEANSVQIVLDATSASAHAANDDVLRRYPAVTVIDLTPSARGPFCVPVVNLQERLTEGARNVNMVTCGGQATIPIVAAVSRTQKVVYAEIVATVASRSAGPGTRANIDEFTRTTAAAIERVGGAQQGKAIIILNPAEPPLIMRDTIHCLTQSDPLQDEIEHSVRAMVTEVQRYVPGYRIVNGPVFDGRRVSVFLQIEGSGDYLPTYAGNLDIMTAAARRTAELVALNRGDRA
jgi:acetaldehyde/propanal dehydrogenase